MSTSSDKPALRTLTQTQVDSYHRDGFLILRSVFTAAEIEALSSEVDRVATSRPELIDKWNMRVRFKPQITTGETLFEVLDPFSDLSSVADSVAHDTRIFDMLHDLYGEPAELFKDKLIYKPAGATGATLHQDWIAWPGFPESFLTVLLAIDPFTAESGATEVYPGLHHAGYLSPKDGQHHLLQPEQLAAEPIPLLLNPGDIAVFGCFTPHRSAPNTSTIARRGYFLSYNARSDGGDQYDKHYREFHDWIRAKSPAEARERLTFR